MFGIWKYQCSRTSTALVDIQYHLVQMAFYEIVLKKESNNIHVSEGKIATHAMTNRPNAIQAQLKPSL